MSEETKRAPGENKKAEPFLQKLVKNPYVATTGTLFCIVTVMALLLALVNLNTKPLIESREKEESLQARAVVLPAATAFAERETPAAGQVESVWEGRGGGVVQGYVCQVKTMGYKGYFSMLVGVDTNGAVTGVLILAPTQETPDMGTRTEDPAWLSQFAGKTDAWALETDGGSVEAVSGATITSRAVANGVSAAVSAVRETMRTGGLS